MSKGTKSRNYENPYSSIIMCNYYSWSSINRYGTPALKWSSLTKKKMVLHKSNYMAPIIELWNSIIFGFLPLRHSMQLNNIQTKLYSPQNIFSRLSFLTFVFKLYLFYTMIVLQIKKNASCSRIV